MGYTSYSVEDRNIRSVSLNYSNVAKSVADTDAVFKQNRVKRVHESMDPKGLKFRECFDSEAHPNTVPIIVALDVTGSMGKIPKDFIMDGLSTMMGTIIQRGTPDAAVCFMAIGDHECDAAPIQVGQFESGDAELDMWLTRTWLEGGGGGNRGESYPLAWYTAAKHTKTDSCSKRNIKGFLFTVGDEPFLPTIPASALKEIFGDEESVQGSISAKECLDQAKECYHVYHFGLNASGKADWQELLGQNYISVQDYTTIPKLIAEIVNSFNATQADPTVPGIGGSTFEVNITL